jgi:hypothetical protein
MLSFFRKPKIWNRKHIPQKTPSQYKKDKLITDLKKIKSDSTLSNFDEYSNIIVNALSFLHLDDKSINNLFIQIIALYSFLFTTLQKLNRKQYLDYDDIMPLYHKMRSILNLSFSQLQQQSFKDFSQTLRLFQEERNEEDKGIIIRKSRHRQALYERLVHNGFSLSNYIYILNKFLTNVKDYYKNLLKNSRSHLLDILESETQQNIAQNINNYYEQLQLYMIPIIRIIFNTFKRIFINNPSRPRSHQIYTIPEELVTDSLPQDSKLDKDSRQDSRYAKAF